MDAPVATVAAVEEQVVATHGNPHGDVAASDVDANAPLVSENASTRQSGLAGSEDPSSKVMVFLSLAQRVRRLKVVFLLIYLLGASSAAAAPNVPDLIVTAFGGNSYLVSGLFSAAKGLLACVYSPAVGSLSDGRNRRWALLIAFVLALFAPTTYLATESYWAFAAVDTVFGVYGPILALLMTCVTDYIPASCPARTESFAMTMFFFLLGVGTGPMAGMAVSAYMSFVISTVLTAASVAATFFLLPEPGKYHAEDQRLAQEYMAAAAEGRCPVLPASRGIVTGIVAASTRSVEEPRREGESGGGDGCPVASHHAKMAAAAGGKCPFNNHHHGAQLQAADSAAAIEGANEMYGSEHTATVNGDDDGHEAAAAAAPMGCCASIRDALHRMRFVFSEHRSLRLVLAIVFWSCLCQEALESSLTLYLKHRVDFTSSDFGPFIAVVALNGLVSLGLVVPSLRRCVGTLTTLKISIAGNILFPLGLAFLYAKWQAYAVTVFGMLGYGVFPCSSSLVAHSVPQHSAGAAQGILTAMRMLAQGIGPAVFGVVFHVTQYSSMPGAAYLIGAACGVIALGVGVVVSRLVNLP